MMVNDPIADMLTRIRNSHSAMRREVVIPCSNIKESMASLMKEEGYITDYSVEERDIKVTLKYAKGRPAISGLKRISKPGRRIYIGVEDIPSVRNGLGICIISTSQGLMTGETAKEKKFGGELLCEIW